VRDPEEGLTGQPVLPRRLVRVGDRVAWYASSVGLERWARLVAVAAVPLLLLGGDFDVIAPLFAFLAAYVLLTALAPRDHRVRAADLVVSGLLIALSGGQVAPFLLFLIVTVAGPASAGGPTAWAAAGGTLSVVLLVSLAWAGDLPDQDLGAVLPPALLLPLVGLTTALATQVLEGRDAKDRLTLQEANRLLSSLRAIADDIPGGLDIATVSAAILTELRDVAGVGTAVVFVESKGLFAPAATAGCGPGEVPVLRLDELRTLIGGGGQTVVLSPRMLPAPLQALGRTRKAWAAVGVGPGGSLTGVLLLGFDEAAAARNARNRLVSLAADAALALENAQLFEATRVRAADAARRRIAGDLHDGVAQSLAHLRMELELLARHAEEGAGDEPARLARVAGSALQDLRATIAGLRRPLDGGLATLVEDHLTELDSASGPRLSLQAGPLPDLDPERTDDVLRVVQEAVSNALRHARAAYVTVSLTSDRDEVVVQVEDDGIGLQAHTVRPGNGVGIRSMRERAERLGGSIDVTSDAGEGTTVHLRFPVERSPLASSSDRPRR
jgi:signal transduction histidine kinase